MPITNSDVELSLMNITIAVKGGKIVGAVASARFSIAIYDSKGEQVGKRTGKAAAVQLDCECFKFKPSQLAKIESGVRAEIAKKETQAKAGAKIKF